MHMLYPPHALQMFASGLDHPEGIAVGSDGTIYAGGELGQIYRISEDGANVGEMANTGGYCLGMALDSSENIYVCDMKRHAVMIIGQGGKCEVFADRVGTKTFARQILECSIGLGTCLSVNRATGRKRTGRSI